MIFEMDTAIKDRKCSVCEGNIKPGTVHLIQVVHHARYPKRVNYCQKCAIKQINEYQLYLDRVILQIEANEADRKYVHPFHILSGAL